MDPQGGKRQRKVLALALLGLAVVAAGWYHIAWRPRRTELRRLAGETAQTEGLVYQWIREAGSLPLYIRTRDDLRTQADRLLRGIPSREDLPALGQRLVDLGAQSGVQVERVDLPLEDLFPVERTDGDGRRGVRTIPLDLEAVGAFHDLGDYLDVISRLESVASVGPLELEARGEGESLRATVRLQVYLKGS